MASISDETLRTDIGEILDGVNLSELSVKKVRKALEEKYGEDMSDRKKTIDGIVMQLVEEKSKAAQESDKSDESDAESSSDDDEPSPPPKKKKKAAAKSNGAAEGSGDEFSDEMLARKLQEQESRGRHRSVKKPVKKQKAPKAEGDGQKRKTGYLKDLKLSEPLAAVVGKDAMPRNQVVKQLWAVIRERNLKDPKDGRYAILDEELQTIFKAKRILAFGMMKYLSNHMYDPDKSECPWE